MTLELLGYVCLSHMLTSVSLTITRSALSDLRSNSYQTVRMSIFICCILLNASQVPIIIVFTKLDLLIDRVEGEAFEAGEDLEPSLLEERIRDEVDKSCIQPLKTIAGEDIPSIAISGKLILLDLSSAVLTICDIVAEGYESTVEQLLESTAGKVDRHVANEAALAAAMAQRANISLKLNSSISYVKH